MTLGEGPLWDTRTQTLHWVDILAGHVWTQGVTDRRARVVEVGAQVTCVALTDRPGVVIAALRGGWHFLDLASGARRFLADPEAQRPNCRFNDGAVDPVGRFWTGSLEDGEANPAGRLYRLDGDLAVDVMDQGVLCANGIDWSPDARSMYFVDSRRNVVYRYAYSRRTGSIGRRTVFLDTSDLDGIPDGLGVDAEGNVWVAFWDGCHVSRFG